LRRICNYEQVFSLILDDIKSWGFQVLSETPEDKKGDILEVYQNIPGTEKKLIGYLKYEDSEYIFQYDRDSDGALMFAFPDKNKTYKSTHLWPFLQFEFHLLNDRILRHDRKICE